MPFRFQPPQLIKQKLLYQGRKFSFEVAHLRLPNQSQGDWECIRHPGGAVAVPVTTDGKLVLLSQYRFTAQGRLIEFPAGTIERGEDPAETVKRELEEETGYCAHQWQSLGKFYVAPGYSDEIIYTFLAQQLELLESPPGVEEDEDIEVLTMTPQELEQAILNGEPIDSKTIASFLLARPFLPQ